MQLEVAAGAVFITYFVSEDSTACVLNALICIICHGPPRLDHLKHIPGSCKISHKKTFKNVDVLFTY